MATYDIEALKSDLPNARDLAQFVYDKTGISLDLIGKPKDEQYLVARNALEGKKLPDGYITDSNPYLDKKELIPVDEMKIIPKRSDDLPEEGSERHVFVATNMPHPLDPQSDRKVQVRFRKYDNGVITYQVSGPVEQVAIGERVNKFGQKVPERYSWIDPRTEELLMRRADGTFTERGRSMFAFCSGEKGGGIWALIDRELITSTSRNITDPWA